MLQRSRLAFRALCQFVRGLANLRRPIAERGGHIRHFNYRGVQGLSGAVEVHLQLFVAVSQLFFDAIAELALCQMGQTRANGGHRSSLFGLIFSTLLICDFLKLFFLDQSIAEHGQGLRNPSDFVTGPIKPFHWLHITL